jgi:PAS domain S-box-containing protein
MRIKSAHPTKNSTLPDLKTSNSTHFISPSPQARLILSLLVWVVYLLAFNGLYKTFSMSADVAALAIIPVAVAGGLCGLRLGLLAGLLSLPINTLLLNWVGHTPGGWNAITHNGGGLGSLIIIIVGVIIGRLHDLRWQLRQQLVERAAIEQSLQESEARTRRILEAALDAVIVINQYDIITEWTPQAEAMFGWTRAEIIGKTMAEMIIPPQYRQVHKQGLEHFLATQEGKIINQRVELSALRRDGREFPIELSVSTLRSGNQWLFSAFVRDITHAKQVELEREQLLASEREQRQLSEILLAAGAELSASLNYDAVLDHVLELMAQVVPYDSANITLIENGHTRITRMRGYEQYGQEVVEFVSALSFEISAMSHLRHMVESKQPFIVVNTATHPDWETHNRPVFIGSWLGAPIVSHGQVIAFFSLDKKEPGFYRPKHAEHVAAFAGQVALALENANLFEQTQAALAQSEGLYQATQTLITLKDLPTMLQSFVNQIAEILPANRVSLVMLDLQQQQIVNFIMGGVGASDIAPFTFEELWHGLTGWAIRHKQPALSPRGQPDPRQSEWMQKRRRQAGTGCMLVVPLRYQDDIFGIMSAANRLDEPDFTQRDVDLMLAVASQAAAAIQNAHLFDKIYYHAQQLALLNELANEMTGLLEVEEICAAIARRLQRVFGYYNVAVLTADLENQELVLQINVGAYANLIQPGQYRQKFGHGLMGKAAQTGQIVMVNDTQQHPDFFELEQMRIRAEIAIPLKVEQKLVGVLNIDSDRLNTFDQSDVAALSTIADQLAIALEKAHLFTETQQRADQLETLRQISQDLTLLSDLKTLLHQIAQQAIRLLNGANGGIFLYNPHQQALEWTVNLGNIKSPVPPTIKPDEGLVGKVWISEQPMVVNDYKNWSGKAQYRLDDLPEAVIGVPIKWGEEFLGVIAVDSLEIGRCFTQDHVTLLSQFAAQAAVAIENARLYEEAHQRVAELEIIRQVSLNLTSSLELQVVLETILESVLHLIGGAHNAHIFLYQAEHLTFGAAMWHDGRKSEPFSQPRPNGLTYRVARQGEPVIVPNIRTHPIFADAPHHWQGAIVGLPLKIGQRVAGVMNVSCLQPRNWTDAELRVLRLLADQAAIAIENARLFEAEHAAHRQAEALREEEQAIQKRVQQHERMAAVGQLAAGIAHDFNNILTSIIGYTELLSYDPTISDSAKEDLSRIAGQGQRAAHLVRQILDFSRQTISPKYPLDLLVFLKETTKLLERTIPEAIHISLTVEPGDYTVLADVTQLQQALTNLAVNARDAMPTGGELRFMLTQFELLSEQNAPQPDMALGKWIALEVTDTGSGIPPEHHDKIFEPFFTTKEVGQGTGLGLAQVYGIIKQHDGYIGLRSAVDAGATFTLYLPALSSGSPESPEAIVVSDMPSGHNEVILLVEDDAQVIGVVTIMLKRLGYQVLTATNGFEGLQVFEQHRREIALVLTDMTMPKMGGAELTATLRKLDPTIKIIALTGYPLDNKAQEGLGDDFVDWLEKPVSISQLAQVIHKHL